MWFEVQKKSQSIGPLFCVVDGDHDDHNVEFDGSYSDGGDDSNGVGDADGDHGGDDGNGGGDGDRDDIASMSHHHHHRRFCTYIG